MTDYVVRTMGASDYPVGGDLAYTEVFSNTSNKRNRTFELFFEAYGFDRLLALSEPLVSLYDANSKHKSLTSLPN